MWPNLAVFVGAQQASVPQVLCGRKSVAHARVWQGFFRIIKYQGGGRGSKTPSLPPTNPLPPSPPLPILQKFNFVVRDSAYLLGVPPSLWGTKSAVYLLALDSSHR